MAKLDPGLRRFLSSPTRDAGAEALDGSGRAIDVHAVSQPSPVSLLIEFEGNVADLKAVGFSVRSRAGNIFTGDIAQNAIGRLEGLEGLKRAEKPRRLTHELEAALPAANVDANLPRPRARRAIIGIIDSGIDYRHPSFQREGASRILAIWDQSLTADPAKSEKAPAPYNYGVEYNREAINEALTKADPLELVRHVDRPPFHGTRVAGIAAGSGHPMPDSGKTMRFVGVAPDADIIVVANTRNSRIGELGLGDSADTLDAVHFILSKANGRPVVINQSQGDHIGPHDGSSMLERGIDALITGSGKVMVKSAGNEGRSNRHAQGDLADAASEIVGFEVHGDVDDDGHADTMEVVIDLWYSGKERVDVAIISPSEHETSGVLFRAPSTANVGLVNGNAAFVDSDVDDPGNHDNRIYIVINRGTREAVQPGTWGLQLSGSGQWHAWIQSTSAAHFVPPFASLNTTITVPGSSHSVITVGSFVSNGMFTGSTNGARSAFSSRGPTRDGRHAPTLCAPGEELYAPQSGKVLDGPTSGTSMAAPVVTGAVARILDLKPTMTAKAIRDCLTRTAVADPHTGPVPSNEWGAGKLDVRAALESVEKTLEARRRRVAAGQAATEAPARGRSRVGPGAQRR